MRKQPVYVLFFCLLCFTFAVDKAYAQDKWIGIKGGLSIPSLTSGSSNPISSGYSSRLGPDFAIFTDHHFSTRFSMVVQLEYSSQGGKKDGVQAFTTPPEFAQMFPPGQAPALLYATYNSEAKFSYLMLPIMAKYTIPLNKSLHFYVAAGPFVSFLLSAKNVTSGSSNVYLDPGETQPLLPPGTEQPFDSNQDIKDDLHSANFGIEGFVGLAYEFGKNRIFFEAGGNYGFVKIQKDATNGQNNTGAAVISLGYALRVFGK